MPFRAKVHLGAPEGRRSLQDDRSNEKLTLLCGWVRKVITLLWAQPLIQAVLGIWGRVGGFTEPSVLITLAYNPHVTEAHLGVSDSEPLYQLDSSQVPYVF